MSQFFSTDRGDEYAPYFLRSIGLSAHYLVDPSGVVIQMRSTGAGAYLAKGHNTDTIGIEFLVKGLHTYESFLYALKTNYVGDTQLKAGTDLCQMLNNQYGNLPITRHDVIDPSRKYDPGEGFPWEEFMNKIQC